MPFRALSLGCLIDESHVNDRTPWRNVRREETISIDYTTTVSKRRSQKYESTHACFARTQRQERREFLVYAKTEDRGQNFVGREMKSSGL